MCFCCCLDILTNVSTRSFYLFMVLCRDDNVIYWVCLVFLLTMKWNISCFYCVLFAHLFKHHREATLSTSAAGLEASRIVGCSEAVAQTGIICWLCWANRLSSGAGGGCVGFRVELSDVHWPWVVVAGCIFHLVCNHVPIVFCGKNVFNQCSEHVPAWMCYTLAQHGFAPESYLAAPTPDRRMLACW